MLLWLSTQCSHCLEMAGQDEGVDEEEDVVFKMKMTISRREGSWVLGTSKDKSNLVMAFLLPRKHLASRWGTLKIAEMVPT